MKLWLDDLREPPDDSWTWARTYAEAEQAMRSLEVTDASLDNDLGEGEPEGRRLVHWMCEHDVWPRATIAVHSANPVASEYMVGMIERYGPFQRVGASHRFRRGPGAHRLAGRSCG